MAEPVAPAAAAAPASTPAADPAATPPAPPAAPASAGNGNGGAITFPNPAAFMQRVRRESAKDLRKLLDQFGVKTVEELDALVRKANGAAPAAAPANGNGNGGGSPTPAKPTRSSKESDETVRKLTETERKLVQEQERNKNLYWKSKVREHAIRSGIVQEEYIEAAIAILKTELAKKKAGEEFDIPAFFAKLKTDRPALFEAPRAPANTGTTGAAPAAPPPAGAPSPTKRVTDMDRGELAAYRARNGLPTR